MVRKEYTITGKLIITSMEELTDKDMEELSALSTLVIEQDINMARWTADKLRNPGNEPETEKTPFLYLRAHLDSPKEIKK